MSNGSITLMAHLIRRAGFGAPREQVETYAAKGYENTVEELINIQEFDPSDDHLLLRYHPNTIIPGGDPPDAHMRWLYHMVNTKRPLEEKMTLFWHQVLATAVSKVDNYPQMLDQINLLRRHAVGELSGYSNRGGHGPRP